MPFVMPMRMTDNGKCNVENPQPCCNGAAINVNYPDLPIPMDCGRKDMCRVFLLTSLRLTRSSQRAAAHRLQPGTPIPTWLGIKARVVYLPAKSEK